jgi:hypothetical protein
VRVACSRQDYLESFRVAYEVYRPLGFLPPSANGLRASPRQLDRTSLVLLAGLGGSYIGTMTVYESDSWKVPSAQVWPEEFARLGARKGALCEFGTLMVRPGSWSGPWACEELFRVGWLFARVLRGCRAVCACVQERHAFFYERRLGFERLGAPRDYHGGGLRIPAVVPLWLDLGEAEAWFRRRFAGYGESPGNLYRRFLVDRGRAESLAALQAGLAARAGLDLEALRGEVLGGARAESALACGAGGS